MEIEDALKQLIAGIAREQVGTIVAEIKSLLERPTRSWGQGSEDELLSTQEVAAELKLHDCTIRQWINTGRLKSVRLGRLVRIRRRDLQEVVKERTPKQDDRWTGAENEPTSPTRRKPGRPRLYPKVDPELSRKLMELAKRTPPAR